MLAQFKISLTFVPEMRETPHNKRKITNIKPSTTRLSHAYGKVQNHIG